MIEHNDTYYLFSTGRGTAVGHHAAYTFDDTDYLIFHGYDKPDEGKAKLIIREIKMGRRLA